MYFSDCVYHEKLALLHCAYQLIASAEGNIDEERDFESISFVLKRTGNLSIHNWDRAVGLNPHDCFKIIEHTGSEAKIEFREIMNQLAHYGTNSRLKEICAESLYKLCNIDQAGDSSDQLHG